MTISANITTEYNTLQAQIKAATPLTSASAPTLIAIGLNIDQLIEDIYDAATAPNTLTLDTWIAPTDPVLIISGIINQTTNAEDQNTLVNMLGYVGRVNVVFDSNFAAGGVISR